MRTCGGCALTSNVEASAVADTSVVIALTLGGHARHRSAVEAHRRHAPALAGHARFEAYSVLTRLPPPGRLSPADAARALRRNYPETVWLGVADQRRVLDLLVRAGVQGGAVYDALVAGSALVASLPLLTSDQRAAATYRALGVEVIIVE